MENIVEKSKKLLAYEHNRMPAHLKDFVEKHFDEIAEMLNRGRDFHGLPTDYDSPMPTDGDLRFIYSNLDDYQLSDSIVSTLQNKEFILAPKGLRLHLLNCDVYLRNLLCSVLDCYRTIQMFNEAAKNSSLFADFDCTDTANKLSSVLGEKTNILDGDSVLEGVVALADYFEENYSKLFAIMKYMALENSMYKFFVPNAEFDSCDEAVTSPYIEYIVNHFDREWEYCEITASDGLGIELNEDDKADPYTYAVMSYLMHTFSSIFYSI